MYLTQDELNNFVPIQNWVLIKPNPGNDEYSFGDIKVKIDVSYQKEQHAPVTGVVYGAPKAIFPASNEVIGMQWDSDMEIQKGDVVTYSYLSAMGALDDNEGRIVICGREIYFLIPYEECYVAKRVYRKQDAQILVSNGELKLHEMMKLAVDDFKYPRLIPLNGYCLVEPVEEKITQRIGNLITESQWQHRPSDRFGRVAHLASLIREYCDGDGAPDTDELKVGDIVCFDRAADLVCEYDLHLSIEGKKTFYHIQRRYIHAIVPPSLIETP